MYIISLVFTTIITLTNAIYTVLALTGALSVLPTSPLSTIPGTIFTVAYSILAPIILILFLYSLSGKKNKGEKNHYLLSLAFGCVLVQTIVSAILYVLSKSLVQSPTSSRESLIPYVIIESIIIAITFIGAIALSIRSANSPSKIEPSGKLLALFVLIFGVVRFVLQIAPVILYRITNQSFFANFLTWSNALEIFDVAAFALSIYVTLTKKPLPYIIMSWIGVVLISIGTIFMRLIAYV